MDRYTLNCEYYLVLKNGEVLKSHLPDHIDFQDGILKASNKEEIDLQLVYIAEDNHQMKISLDIARRTQINIIETKILDKHASLIKEVCVHEDAIVHMFSENNCHNEETVQCKETVVLKKNAVMQCGYAELSDGSYHAAYHYHLDGEGADAKVRMAVLSKENEKKHFEVSIQHLCPHTYGQMDNYGVVKDQASLTIDGIGTISKGQHGSASHQTNKIMVFDPECKASANPYLYIDEYDVKASHAAGVGKMDEDHLYYLQSRGLTKKQAMHLITYGYLKPVIEVVDNEMLKEHFESVLSKVGA